MVQVNFRCANGALRTISAATGASLMEAALIAEIEGIDGECGGAGMCGTCHVAIDDDWQARLSAPESDEREMIQSLGSEPGRTRLACQIAVSAALEGIVVRAVGDAQ